MNNQDIQKRIKKLKEELSELQEQHKKQLKHFRGVIHEDASSEYKYIRLKVLQNRIHNLQLTIEELESTNQQSLDKRL